LVRFPQPIVTITVGKAPNCQVFSFHKDFLCHHSPFFDRAFNGSFKEGITQNMDLDDVEPTTFGLLASWVYTKKVEEETEIADGQRKEGESSGAAFSHLARLSDLWLLGQRFLLPELQNKVIDRLWSRLTFIYPRSSEDQHNFYRFAYTSGIETLKNIAVLHFAEVLGQHTFTSRVDALPVGMLGDVAKYLKATFAPVQNQRMELEPKERYYVETFESV
jgi:hypothetical protein